jgi:peptidyl-prolyl cis-trans isomerase D
VVVPITPFRAGLNPSDADLQRFYTANRARYTVPEQRVARFALIGPQQVAEVAATDQEIAAYYNANQATYGPRDSRVLSQVVVPDQATAAGIAARAKAGATLAAAAAPAGSNAAVTSLGEQSRPAYAGVAGDKVAAAVFSAPSGAVVGPVQSDFGWVVVKVESVKAQAARPLAAVKGEIATKLSADKRKQALDDLINRVQDALDDGQNFAEAAASAKLPVTTTPLVMADGKSRTDASYRLPAEFAPALKTTFEIAPNDPPEIVTLAGGQSNAMVSPAEVVPATPAPLASIRDRVVEDWVAQQALNKARSVASAIATKASAGSIEDAVRQAGVALPPVRPVAGRRIQIAQATGPISAVMRMLFTLTAGKSRIVPDPDGRGFIVVKVEKIVPGNALLQPGLISQMQSELQQATSQDYARQFLTAVREQLKVRRNESAIASAKERLSGS